MILKDEQNELGDDSTNVNVKQMLEETVFSHKAVLQAILPNVT